MRQRKNGGGNSDRRRAEAVERNPTDLQLRFELGEHLVNAGQFRDALPELQRARQNPNARLKAMNLLGHVITNSECSISPPNNSKKPRGKSTMDAMKKEIVYNLGLVFEQMGD